MSLSDDDRRLAQINADSAAHVHASGISCRITREHVASSREAIDRSLQLLNRTARLNRD